MKTEIIYCTHKGNTRKVAEAIGEALRQFGPAEVVAVEEAASTLAPDTELVLIGGPTEGHGMTAEVRRFLDHLDAETLRGKSAAAFDTRMNWPRLLSGSAASGIETELEEKGARVIRPSGSFLVSGAPTLLDGELERAGEWARRVASDVAPAVV